MNIQARNLSLDVFRGLTICFMIIVNTAGSWSCVYWPLDHAKWHGFTPTDLVFPSFLFAVGSSIFFSKKSWEHMNASDVYWKIIKRGAIIFLIGYLMYWFPFVKHSDAGLVFKPFHNTRVMGVLQRIGLCYIIGSFILLKFSFRSILAIGIGLLLLYWGLLAWGGDFEMTTNLGHKIDLALFGDSHLYHGEGVAFDPEGLLSTMPSIVNVLGGYLVTSFMINGGITKDKLMKLALVGFGILILSWVWNMVFPINKKIWTSSFVLHTVGWDMIILSILSYLVDILNVRKGVSFFYVAGRNPLFLYLLHELIAILLLFFRTSEGKSYYSAIFETVYKPLGCHLGSFLFSLTFMLVCWTAGWYLNKRGWYFKV